MPVITGWHFLGQYISINFETSKLSIMNYVIIAYIVYLLVALLLILFVARNLFRNGQPFLDDIFSGNPPLAQAINNLLLVGFYLVTAGYSIHALTIAEKLATLQTTMEVLSIKLGTLLLILGILHFMNMFIFLKLRKNAVAGQQLKQYHQQVYSTDKTGIYEK
jgi:hypothetical protein